MFNAVFTEILLGLLAVLLVVAAVIDMRTFTISNRLNAAVAVLAPLYWLSVGLTCGPAWRSSSASRSACSPCSRLPFASGMMGGGDVKLAAALALWFSPEGDAEIPRPDVARGRRADRRHARRCTACASARDGPKFRTEWPSLSAVSRFSPNGFLTNLPDV